MGWTGAAVPEKWGGTGLSHIDLCAIAEELGRVIAPIPFASTVYIFSEAILAFGSRDPNMFDDGQATDQVSFLARVVERSFRAWLHIG